MKGGRLKLVNESRYPTEEVEPLVRFGLQEIDVKGSKLLVFVGDTRRCAYRGYGGRRSSFLHVSSRIYHLARAANAGFVAQVLIGPPERFPIRPYRRNGQLHDYTSWQEAVVGLTAHEGAHVQFCYDDAPYGKRSLVRRKDYQDGLAYRVLGDQRVEPKCDAFEWYMVRRYRGVN